MTGANVMTMVAVWIAAGAGGAIPAAAQEAGAAEGAGALSLDQAVEGALARYPSVSASEAGVEEAQAGVGKSQAGLWPSLRAGASATRYEEPYPVFPIHGFTPEVIPPFERTLVQAQLQATYTFESGGGRFARVRGARAHVREAEASLEQTREALIVRVVATYLEVLAQSEVLSAHDQRVAALRRERARAGDLLEHGKAARVELLRAEAALADAEAGRVRGATALSNAEEELARLLVTEVERTRAPALRKVDLADTLLPERADLLAQAGERSAAARRARAGEAAARADRAAAKSARWPDLHLVGTHTSYGDGESFEEGEWSAAFQAGLPLFTGGAIGKEIERASAAHRAAREQVRVIEAQLGEEIDRAAASALEAAARVRSLTKAVAAHEEVARIEKLALEAGSGTQTDYLQAEADLLSARAGLVEARHGRIRAHLEIARLTGNLSLSWLRQHLETAP